MTPQFTTPCYVQVEDKDKRKEVCEQLERIGYHVFKAINSPSGDTIFTDLFFADASYTNEPSYVIWKNHMVVNQLRNTHIDCGTNTDLFLALAGMRSDTDEGQWFVSIEPNGMRRQFWDSIPSNRWRKATTQEVIEYFNNK